MLSFLRFPRLARMLTVYALVSTLCSLLLISFISVSQSHHAYAFDPTVIVDAIHGDDTTGGADGITFKTFARAQQEINAIAATAQFDIHVLLRGDIYIDSTVTVSPQITQGYSIRYISDTENPARIHGAHEYTQGWSVYENSIYVIDIPDISYQPRDIYINDEMQTRSTSAGDASFQFEQTGPFEVTQLSGYPIASMNNQTRIEFEGANKNYWKHTIQRVESVQGSVATVYDHTDLKNQDQTPYDDIAFKGDDFIHMTNAYELINTDGEWYFNENTKQLFLHYPTNPNGLTLSIPYTETLLSIENTSNISFEGVTFMYGAFNSLPNTIGIQTMGQGGIINTNTTNQKGFAENPVFGAISMEYARDITFQDSSFLNISSAALTCSYGCINHTIQRNTFHTIGAGAIMYSRSYGVDIAGNQTEYITIEDNYISDIGVQYYGSAGINILFGHHNIIEHNTIENVPYTGIQVGWGWDPQSTLVSNNSIAYNKIDTFLTKLYDGGAIYTLSNQPNTVIHHNYVVNAVHDHAALYPDDGSSNISLFQNVIDTPTKYWAYVWRPDYENRMNNLSFTDNYVRKSSCDTHFGSYSSDPELCELVRGTNTIKQNNTGFDINQAWSTEAQSIIDTAGVRTVLEPATRSFSVQVVLSGAFNTNTQKMNTTLSNQSLLPSSQPFASRGYMGNEHITVNSLVSGRFVDWVLVELVASDRSTVLDRFAALVSDTGSITLPDGNTTITTSIQDEFYVKINHTNHISIQSQHLMNEYEYAFDLTDIQNVYGQNVIEMSPSVHAMRMGNVTGDGAIDSSDRNALRTIPESSDSYSQYDINLDGSVDAIDRNLLRIQPESYEI